MPTPRFLFAALFNELHFRRLAAAWVLLLGTPLLWGAGPLPREQLIEYFQAPVFSQPKLSPTGEYIGFIVRHGDEFALGMYTIATGKVTMVRGDKLRPAMLFWKGERRLLVASVPLELRGISYTAVDVDGGNAQEVWRMDRASGRVVDPLLNDPTHILVADRDGVHRFDFEHGKSERLAGGELGMVGEWILDEKSRPRAALTRTHDGTLIFEWNAGPGEKWHRTITKTGGKTFEPFCVSEDPRYLLGWDDAQGGESVISRFDTLTEKREVVVRKKGLDPTNFVLQGTTRRPMSVGYGQGAEMLIEPLDEAERSTVEALRQRFAGFNPVVLDHLPDHVTWLVHTSNSRLPGAYVLFNSKTGEVTPIALTHSESLAEDRLAPAEFFSFGVRAGRTLTGRLWRPADVDRPPLILICPRFLPGLPALDRYLADVQALVACGFAVARVNVRGTSGFGDAWREAATGDIAAGMTEDLEDAARELTRQGVVDANRISVLGWQLGGALALQVASRSDVFAAAVAVNPPAKIGRWDLTALSEERDVNLMAEKLGGWWEIGRVADSLSPVEAVARLRAPALVLNDQQSTGGVDEDGALIRRAAKNAGKSVKVDLAYSWSHKNKLPSVQAREDAEIIRKVADFLAGAQRPNDGKPGR